MRKKKERVASEKGKKLGGRGQEKVVFDVYAVCGSKRKGR